MGPAHHVIGFAAKSTAPELPLWVLLGGNEVLDLLSFGFEDLDLEEFAISHTTIENGLEIIVPGSIPWSHGLFMSVIWSLLTAAVVYLVSHDRRASGVLGLVVFSHWVLDLIVHPPDLPLLFQNSPKVGLGLWTTGPGFIASVILEVVLFLGGIVIYILHRRRSAPIGLKE